jgi:hypothetical protein
LVFQYFGFDRTRWRCFQKRVLRTKFDIYDFINRCPASPAVKLYPSSFDEVKFSIKAFEFKSSPGSIVYIHCQISVCSPTHSQCVTGCKSRHRRDVDEADDSSHLVSGGPYLLVADKGMYRYFINNFNCLIYSSSILRKFLCKYVSPSKRHLFFNPTYYNLGAFFTGTDFNGIV